MNSLLPILQQADAARVFLLAQDAAAVQVAASPAMPSLGVFLVSFAFVLALVLGVVALGLRHARYERELEHAERMRAIEMGVTLASDQPFWSPGKLALGMGIVMPIAVCSLALKLGDMMSAHLTWTAATLISVAGVIGATILAVRKVNPPTLAVNSGKPRPFDPDTLDARGWTDSATR